MSPRCWLAVAGAVFCLAGAAADPADQLKNPDQEARARTLFREVRCVVCQSESIDESDADLARDLRQVVRQRVAAGASDADIKAYLVSRYGEFILLRPRFSPGNAALWLTPFLVVVLGAGVVLVRRRPEALESDELSEPEKARLAALTDN
ncbi:MAG TPA: cytochrome c-type biogenesis protein [Caulobacteraceae bacterium]|jgi:cytochrome c-type biogenesis protein CcmH|nr:cytochrome c-type biogenesis protein [Caulobacteraceae bacterium]